MAFGAFGTVRKDRRGVPSSVKTPVQRSGEVAGTVDDSILSLKRKDKRDVLMLCIYHNTHMVTKTR